MKTLIIFDSPMAMMSLSGELVKGFLWQRLHMFFSSSRCTGWFGLWRIWRTWNQCGGLAYPSNSSPYWIVCLAFDCLVVWSAALFPAPTSEQLGVSTCGALKLSWDGIQVSIWKASWIVGAQPTIKFRDVPMSKMPVCRWVYSEMTWDVIRNLHWSVCKVDRWILKGKALHRSVLGFMHFLSMKSLLLRWRFWHLTPILGQKLGNVRGFEWWQHFCKHRGM